MGDVDRPVGAGANVDRDGPIVSVVVVDGLGLPNRARPLLTRSRSLERVVLAITE